MEIERNDSSFSVDMFEDIDDENEEVSFRGVQFTELKKHAKSKKVNLFINDLIMIVIANKAIHIIIL